MRQYQRHMLRTRLEDTRIWLTSRLMEHTDAALEKRIARALTERAEAHDKYNYTPESVRKMMVENHIGTVAGYRQLEELLSVETEETFSFGRFHEIIEQLEAGVYDRPVRTPDGPRTDFFVQSGCQSAYSWMRSHLTDRIEMTIPGRVHMKFDRKPRNRSWKSSENFAHCASLTA